MGVPVTNFAKVTMAAGYDEAATSAAVLTGHGSRLPSTFPYPLVWWNATDYPDPADDPNREIITVSLRTGDTLSTIVRGAEGTTATVKNLAGKTYKMVLALTKGMYDAILDLSLSQNFRNLTLQTHPDSDVAHKKVRLVHADAIVMNDGMEVADWDDIDADITASGIGGLDTGAEQASAWYEIHAMYNGTLKKLQLHQAKQYFIDEGSSAGEDASQGLRSAVDNSTVKIAQGFKVDTAGLVEFIDVKLLKTGTPAGNYWFTIEASSGGVPTNTPLATSDKYDVSSLTTTAGWVRLPFRTPATLAAATQYHLVMYGDFTVSASNFASWRMDGSAGAYANGSKALFDSDTSTWTTVTDDDMMFSVYVTMNDTPLTENGYTQHALIGYVRNNASSNFKHFWQHDRTVFCGKDIDWKIGSLAAGVALLDLFAFVPPVAVELMGVGMNATATGVALGVLSATDVSALYTDERVGVIQFAIPINGNGHGHLNVSAYQGVMFDSGAGTTSLYVGAFTW